MADTSPQPKMTFQGFVIWFLAIFFFLYEFALRTILGTFTHQIIPALHLTPWSYSIVDSAYALSFLIFAVPMGILTDKLGVRWTMTIAMVLLAGATLLYSVSDNFTMGLLSRLLMGAGSSLSFVSVVIILMMWFPKKQFAFLVGISQFIATLGPMLGGAPLIYYIHQVHESWRVGLREIGFLGLAAACLMLLIVREKQRTKALEHHYVQGVGQVLFYLKTLIRQRQVWWVIIYTGTSYAGFQLLATIWGAEYLQVRGLTQLMAASCITAGWVGYAIACPLFGVISDKLKQRKSIMSVMALIGVVAAIILFYIPHLTASIYLLLFLLLGVSASGQNLSFVLLAEKIPAEVKATATALNNSSISVCVAVITLISSFVINDAVIGNIKNASTSDFKIAFVVLPIMLVIAFVMSKFAINEKTSWFVK